MESSIPAVLGESQVSPEHLQDVSHVKRFLERWVMDPSYRDAYHADPVAALAMLRLKLRPEELTPLIDSDAATQVTRELKAGNTDACALVVKRYRAFIREKLEHRGRTRSAGEPVDAGLAAWRQRQVHRCAGELGPSRAAAIVHAPFAIELSKGCTVGCWFCGVAAPQFDHNWPYTPENAALWRETLGALGSLLGPAAAQGFLYWATDPLDNPGYERFLADFHTVLGRCPQTTTAIAHKDLERTRKLLELAKSLNSYVDRFSITSLKFLEAVHEAFTPEEMVRIECVPQNRESADHHRKSNAGRAREFAGKRQAELATAETSSTIACVSGFLLNMVDKSVKLITPCNASERWPLGYWIVDEATFETGAELHGLLREMVRSNCGQYLGAQDRIRLRADVRAEADGDHLVLSSLGLTSTVESVPHAAALAATLTSGEMVAAAVALSRYDQYQVPLEHSMALLEQLFQSGLFDEEPAVVPVAAIPQPRRTTRTADVRLSRAR